MDNPEKTKGAINNGQSRENQRGNEEWTIQRKQKGQ
jgi:predicted lipid-binding transport protein (Tim44 family)